MDERAESSSPDLDRTARHQEPRLQQSAKKEPLVGRLFFIAQLAYFDFEPGPVIPLLLDPEVWPGAYPEAPSVPLLEPLACIS